MYLCEVRECCFHILLAICKYFIITKHWDRTKQNYESYLSLFRAEVLNHPVNLNCVPQIPDIDVKRHQVNIGSGN